MKKTMKQCIASILTLVVALGILVAPVTSKAADYGTVTFVVDGTSTEYTFVDGSETIGGTNNRGAAHNKGGVLDKGYFMGWSTTPDYSTTAGAPLWYSSQTIGEAFPEGIPAGTSLYPIYFLRTAGLTYMTENSVTINDEKSAAQTLPDSEIQSDTFSEELPKGTSKEATVYYEPDKTSYSVVLDSKFTTNKNVAHWLYSGNGHTIMTNTQSYDEEGKASTAKDANYVHVDLNVHLGPEVSVPEKLSLTFEGFYFQPYMVFDSKREKLTIEETGSWKIGDLVSNTDPKTTFTVLNPNRDNTIVVRTILRTNGAYGGKYISGVSADRIEKSNMKLTSAPTNALLIPADKAKALAESGNSVAIDGVINGYVIFTNLIREELPDEFAHNPLEIKFVYKEYDVTYSHGSATVGREIPVGLLEEYPLTGTKVRAGEVATVLDLTGKEYVVDGGKWIFKEWTPADRKITGNTTLTAVWEFVENEPTPQPEPTEPKPTEPKSAQEASQPRQQVRAQETRARVAAPKTADTSSVWGWMGVVLLFSVSTLVLRKKER